MGNLKFNGKSTEDLGLVIQTPPSYTFPEKDISSVHIPGRNGDLYINTNSYKNVERTYSIAKGFRKGTKLYTNSQEILAWLTSSNGNYARLEDTYDDEVYRLAVFNASGSFVNYFDKATSIDITFQCKPQRFLKSGEKPVIYESSIAEIENPSHYYSLPEITLINVPSEVSDILMMTVEDNNGKSISNITLSHISDSDTTVKIDSENQTVVNGSGNNISEKLGLNGANFPELREGKTVIKLNKYQSEDTGIIESYNTLIGKNNIVGESLYKPIDKIATEKEKKVLIKPWSQMVSNAQKAYYAEAYQSYVQSFAEEFTFASVNDVLDAIGQSTIKFSGHLTDFGIDSDTYDFVTITETDGKYTATAKKAGYFKTNQSDWKILKYFGANAQLFSNVPNTQVIEIKWYPAIDIDEGNKHQIDINYTNAGMPSWIQAVVISNSDAPYNPIRVEFKPNAAGYFYLPKSSIFGKAAWQQVSSGSYPTFDSMEWRSDKEAFVSTDGLFKKTDKTYTYSYLATLEQYKPASKDENIYFSVSADGTLSTLIIYAEYDGWYKFVEDGDKYDAIVWQKRTIGQQISSSAKGTKSFEVFYIGEDPDRVGKPNVSYAKEENWPDWISPYPLHADDDVSGHTYSKYEEIELNAPSGMLFKVYNGDKFYRYYPPEPGEQYVEFEEPEYIESKDIYIITDLVMTVKDTYYVCIIDQQPVPYPPYDRCYVTYDEDGLPVESDTPPDWLIVEIQDDPIEQEDQREMYYKAGAAGYFKWDTNSSWVYKNQNDALLNSKIQDDTVFYYMEHLPQYANTDYQLYDLIKLEPFPRESETPDNPNKVEITVRVSDDPEVSNDGYYRANANTDWKYYKEGDVIVTSKVGETNQIWHLEPSEDTLDNMQIIIIPRWWML